MVLRRFCIHCSMAAVRRITSRPMTFRWETARCNEGCKDENEYIIIIMRRGGRRAHWMNAAITTFIFLLKRCTYVTRENTNNLHVHL